MLYPQRYGSWDKSINLYTNQNLIAKNLDLVIIGTPPCFLTQIAIEQLKRSNILIEKPLTYPNDKKRYELFDLIKKENANCFVGYNHSVSPGFEEFLF